MIHEQHLYTIRCDHPGCTEAVGVRGAQHAVIIDAIQLGWRRVPTGHRVLDYCPAHRPEQPPQTKGDHHQ